MSVNIIDGPHSDALELLEEASLVMAFQELGLSHDLRWVPVDTGFASRPRPSGEELMHVHGRSSFMGKLVTMLKRIIRKLIMRHLMAQAEINRALVAFEAGSASAICGLNGNLHELQRYLLSERRVILARVKGLERRIEALESRRQDAS